MEASDYDPTSRWLDKWKVKYPMLEPPIFHTDYHHPKMPSTFTHQFDTATYKGAITINTGLYIDGKFVDPVEPATVE
jgi:hypothetical protein